MVEADSFTFEEREREGERERAIQLVAEKSGQGAGVDSYTLLKNK